MDRSPQGLELAKDYVANRNITSLFEALMTALMVEKPENHIRFLIEALEQCQDQTEFVRWDAFIRKKGGTYNILTPIKLTTSHQKTGLVNGTSSPSTINSNKTYHAEALQGKVVIFISGGPGSGKGTQCKKIAETYGFTHLSVGDLIRAAANDAAAGKGDEFNATMSEGKLIPTEEILDLLKDAILKKAKLAKGFIIDGFPRRIDQGMQFEREVVPCAALIYFNVSDEILTERMINRGKTSGRIDDNIETIEKRLETFHSETTPILGYYGKQGKLITIDTDGNIDSVFEDVKKALDALIKQQPKVPVFPQLDLNKFQNTKLIVVVGGPGAEKRKYAEDIAQKYHYNHISMGVILREIAQQDNELGETVANYVNQGKLVPMHLVFDILQDCLMNYDGQSKGLVIDGFPRDIEQARRFREFGLPCSLVVFVKADSNLLSERLSRRCESSDRIDDNKDAIQNRLYIFRNYTIAVLDFYERDIPIADIDLEVPSDEQWTEVEKEIHQFN